MLMAQYLKRSRLFKGGNIVILAVININGDDEMKVYYSFEELHKDLFCPDDFLVWMTDFKIKGATYAERKQFARDIGINISNYRSVETLTFTDAINVAEQLDTIAKRYGLVEEFRENGLI